MDCLQKILCGERVIIGVRNFDGCTTPESQLFINDYPGCDLKTASKITNDELVTGNKALKECVLNAVKYVNSNLMDYVNQRFRFNNIVETRQTDVNFSSTEIIPAANLDRGRTLTRWRSELARTYIEEIYVKPDADIVEDIYIQDGTVLKKYEAVVLKANKVNVVPIRYIAKSEKITIYINQKNAGFYACNGGSYKFRGCCQSRKNSTDTELLIEGWNGTQEDTKCYGIGVLAMVKCYFDDVFCALLPNLYFPIYYRSVYEFMQMRIHTNRVNNIATFGEEKAREIRDEVDELFNEKMKRVTDNSNAYLQSVKGDCLTCNSMYYVQSTP
jgi:hypothetical protein